MQERLAAHRRRHRPNSEARLGAAIVDVVEEALSRADALERQVFAERRCTTPWESTKGARVRALMAGPAGDDWLERLMRTLGEGESRAVVVGWEAHVANGDLLGEPAVPAAIRTIDITSAPGGEAPEVPVVGTRLRPDVAGLASDPGREVTPQVAGSSDSTIAEPLDLAERKRKAGAASVSAMRRRRGLPEPAQAARGAALPLVGDARIVGGLGVASTGDVESFEPIVASDTAPPVTGWQAEGSFAWRWRRR